MAGIEDINPLHPVWPVRRPDQRNSDKQAKVKRPKKPASDTEVTPDEDGHAHHHVDEYV